MIIVKGSYVFHFISYYGNIFTKHFYIFKSDENQLFYAWGDKKNDTRVRKYARYGKTSYNRATEMWPKFQIFQGLPENIKIYFNPLKIDRVRSKTVKTRFARGQT